MLKENSTNIYTVLYIYSNLAVNKYKKYIKIIFINQHKLLSTTVSTYAIYIYLYCVCIYIYIKLKYKASLVKIHELLDDEEFFFCAIHKDYYNFLHIVLSFYYLKKIIIITRTTGLTYY